jgi:hypothetical protein
MIDYMQIIALLLLPNRSIKIGNLGRTHFTTLYNELAGIG